jgi:hypothetical protein
MKKLVGLRRRLTYANVIATLALFFAMTGGAMAGAKFIVATDTIPATSDLAGSTYGNPQIAAGKVATNKIATGAITSSKFDASAVAPNADKLDGLDSSAFAGAGSSYTKSESDARYLGINDKAADSDLLDGLDSSSFLGVNAKAADSDRLDGKDSTDFLGVSAKAADSDKLDGFDSSAFLRGTISIATSSASIGAGGWVSSFASCGNGKVLGGGVGFSGHEGAFDQVTHSHPNSTGTSWEAGIVNGAPFTDTAVIYAICLS